MLIESKYPRFKGITVDDKNIINSIVLNLPAYSDFDFTSLFSWNINNRTEYSILNGNLIIRLEDYSTNRIIYSLFGKNQLDNTLEILFTSRVIREFCLVPEFVIKRISKDKFNIISSRDHYDYIYNLKNFIDYNGRNLKVKRYYLRRFIKFYINHIEVKQINILNNRKCNEILRLFGKWERLMNKNKSEVVNELKALKKLLSSAAKFNLIIIGIYYEEKLIAFSLVEVIQRKYSIVHFEKADISYIGIYEFLKHSLSKLLIEMDCKYLNYEQDLGMDGLRQSKLSYRPTRFFRKYKIRRKN
jgi:hypothetical protein